MTEVMIIVLLLTVVALALWYIIRRTKRGGGCCGEHEEAVAKVVVSDRNKKHYPYQVTMNIGGMTCLNCARRVENALNSLAGVWATVDIADKKAKVLLKQKPDEKQLYKAVISAGYSVNDIFYIR